MLNFSATISWVGVHEDKVNGEIANYTLHLQKVVRNSPLVKIACISTEILKDLTLVIVFCRLRIGGQNPGLKILYASPKFFVLHLLPLC